MRRNSLTVFFLVLFLTNYFSAKTQFTDSFDNGNFTTNPVWIGNTNDWIVNTTLQLQSNSTVANSNFYLSTANALATKAQWEFWCRLAFIPSSANYVDVYLTASSSNVTQSNVTGYYVRLGNTTKDISLYRKNANGTSTLIIGGVGNTLNSSNNIFKVKVIRDSLNKWTLFRDMTGTGNNYVSDGFATDATFTTSAYFGIWVRQSTSSFFQKHYFDDFEVKPYVPDTIPPSIQSVNAVSANAVDVLFSKPVHFITSQINTNYFVNNGIGNPASSVRDASNSSLVHLTFANNLPNGINCELAINGVQDFSGNAINNGIANFAYYTAQRYDVVIDEIMVNTSPQVGLPNNKWIELKNVSSFPLNLQGWRISNSNGQSGPLPNFVLRPDSFVIVCTGSAVAAMSSFGTVISVTNFPSFLIASDLISLRDVNGKTIHAVAYSDAWYQNELKKNGGWSLEMIDTKSPCMGSSNWKASVHPAGGTPGKKNSIDAINTDAVPLQLKRTYTLDSLTIVAVFDKPVDSTIAANPSNYSIDGGLSISFSTPVSPLFNNVQLKLNQGMRANTVYNLTVKNIKDCKGNLIGNYNKAKAGLPVDANTSDIVVNEILFHPRNGAYSFVEFFNRSNKIFDASRLSIANRNSSGVISSIKQLSSTPRLIFPGDYPVVTQDANNLQQNYFVQNPDWIFTLSSLPSFPNDKGYVLLLNQQGNGIDEVNYDHRWHFKLINNETGISLERIDPEATSQDGNNWHSSASTSGYATPTYKNSQYKQPQMIYATIEVSPKIFSPDNDGHDDIAVIQYKVSEAGYVANITVFDVHGRPVRYLVKNGTLGLNGYWNWDGLDEKGLKLPIGTYIVYTEIFNLKGKKQQFKNTIVLARKLN
jgi:hypothetical protein